MIVPVRATPLFCETACATTPFPVPLDPAVMVIHGSVVVAVHVQKLCPVTEIKSDAACQVWSRTVGVIANPHVPASCVTVNGILAIVMVPVRCVGLWFAATE